MCGKPKKDMGSVVHMVKSGQARVNVDGAAELVRMEEQWGLSALGARLMSDDDRLT